MGPRTARRLQEFGIETVEDLLEHFPRRYEDFRDRRRIADLRLGEEATVRGTVDGVRVVPTRRRGLTVIQAALHDDSGTVEAVWFNQSWLTEVLSAGVLISVRGTLKRRGGSPVLQVKSHEVIDDAGDPVHTEGIVPMYPASEAVSARLLRGLIRGALPLARGVPDPLPAKLRVQEGLPSRCDALLGAHAPRRPTDGSVARRRLVFEELLLLQLGLLLRKEREQVSAPAPALPPPGTLTTQFIAGLPFKLTNGQRRSIDEIDRDLTQERPMRRLLQGDVGSGKTVIAIYALLRAVEAGHQGALVVPTEALAGQHLATLHELVGESASCDLVTAALTAAQRREARERLRRGETQVAVGTHALLQEDVGFRSLALAVVDEQHRFGVAQRDELTRRETVTGVSPHLLAMTATPIPRSLALTLYGDLDLTVLDVLPTGRRRVVTRIVPEARRPDAYDLVRRELAAGRQAYVVCPTIEESESLSSAAATEEAARLADGELREYRVSVLHGQMKAVHREATMRAFKQAEIDVLVATTVIEVGIDVPNASVMVIEGAERFGLAQLHQLRGRVGRGKARSYCLLFARAETPQAQARLQAVVHSNDGFELADRDLEIRGEGQVLGSRQSGRNDLRLARLARDRETLQRARLVAQTLLQADPSLDRPQNALLKAAVEAAFGERIDGLLRT